jgi:hypothetical protein
MNFPWETDEHYKEPELGKSASRLRIELWASKRKIIQNNCNTCRIFGFHSGGYEEFYPLRYNAV